MTGPKLMQSIRLFAICIMVIFCFGAGGEICGAFFETTAAAFGTKFPDNRAEDIGAVMARIQKAKAVDGQPENSKRIPIVVLVTEEKPRSLMAMDLTNGKKLWKITPSIQSEVTLSDDLVIYSSTSSINAHDIFTGKKLWSHELEEGWNYHGADVDDGIIAISVGVGGKDANQYANGRVVALEAKTGVPIWNHLSGGGLLGEPLVYAGMVFVPWDRQKIAILDATDGQEICRILASDFTINFVEGSAQGVFYGSTGSRKGMSTLYRFDDNSATGKRDGTTAFAPSIELVPGEPSFRRDAFAGPVSGRSASEKIRFHWKPAAAKKESISMERNLFYLHYWRYIFALDSATGQLKWAYRSDKDIESIKVVTDHVLGVDTAGELFAIQSATGARIWKGQAESKIVAAVFDADGFKPEAKGESAAAADPITSLKEIIWDRDNRMLPIRAYAAFLLAAFPQPEVTRELLQIYSNAATPKGLRNAVVQALSGRTSGGNYLVDALHMRYDFLEQTQPPPMNVVAPALVNMKEKSAVPGLLSHLMDHETSMDHLPHIVTAIRDLGDISTVGTLKQFVTLYHADSSFIEHENTLALATESILKFDNKEEAKRFMTKIMDDPQTLPALKTQIEAILSPEIAAQKAREAKELAEKKAAQKRQKELEQSQAAAEANRVPDALSRSTINRTIAGYQEHFKPCVQAALGIAPTLQTIRMRFVITGHSGEASDLRILPNNIPNLAECLSSSLGMVSFPRFRNLRQMATYTITIHNNARQQATTAPSSATKDTNETEVDPDAFEKPGGDREGQDPDAF